jgi:hypothetical protein
MKRLMIVFGGFVGLIVLGVVAAIVLTPWMNRWGATDEELSVALPGDELVPNPAVFINRAVTVQASPEQIFPWLVQLGADKGGMYSYTWLESLIRCPQVNAERIHEEWQNLQVGDQVKMCVGEFAPPPYIVAQIHPDRALVLGHQENGEWVDLWQFILTPQSDGATRLLVRTRTMMTGGFWDLIRPGVFIMERGMLQGVKARAEKE